MHQDDIDMVPPKRYGPRKDDGMLIIIAWGGGGRT
jgi:hypothetical protein